MQKYEYLLEDISAGGHAGLTPKRLIPRLNAKGTDGWLFDKLITVAGGYIYLLYRRPLEEKDQTK